MDCMLRRGRALLTSTGRLAPDLILSTQHQTIARPAYRIRWKAISHTHSNMAASEPTAAMPPMMYGTAWKKERTADLVYEAIKAGFRGIDTAAMKKHYDEALTGEGIRRAIREGLVSRKDLFIQTKFTPLDLTSPHNPSDPIPTQIHTSIRSSLTNLSPRSSSSSSSSSSEKEEEEYIDALILHSPFPSIPQTLEALAALQSYLPSSPDPSRRGRVRRLGISNVPSLAVLQILESQLPGAVSIVQNRFRAAERSWDREIRAWCRAAREREREGGGGAAAAVVYQGFWTLTGNVSTWQQQQQGGGFVAELARGAGVELAEAWYALVMEAGVVVLNGTGDRDHMRGDLAVRGRMAEWRATEEGSRVWERCWGAFKQLIDG